MRGSSKPRGAEALRVAGAGFARQQHATRDLLSARAAIGRMVIRPYIDRAPTLVDAIARAFADLAHLARAEHLALDVVERRAGEMREDDICECLVGERPRATPRPRNGISRVRRRRGEPRDE